MENQASAITNMVKTDGLTVGNLCRINGGVYEGRLGFLLELDELWARVELADGLLILSSSLVEGLEG